MDLLSFGADNHPPKSLFPVFISTFPQYVCNVVFLCLGIRRLVIWCGCSSCTVLKGSHGEKRARASAWKNMWGENRFQRRRMEIHVNSFTLAYFAHGWTWVWLFATAAYYAAQAGTKVHPATCDIQVCTMCTLCTVSVIKEVLSYSGAKIKLT